MIRQKTKTEVDSMELRLFDARGNVLFNWKRAPKNFKTGKDILRKKGITI